MGHKVAETTCNINNTFGLGTANEHTMQWWFKKFCKGPLKMRNTGWPSEVDNDQLRGPSKLLLLQLHEKLLKNSTSTILWSFSIGSKLERWKSLISGCLMNCTKIRKTILFEYCLLLFYTTTTHFSIRLWCAMKSGFYMTTGTDQFSGWTEMLQSTSQSQTCTQKRSRSLFGGLLPIWSTFLLSESQQNHYIWDVCSANQWDAPTTAMPEANAGQQKGPNSSPWQRPSACHTTNTSSVDWISLQSFASSAMFTWPIANRLPLL